jgi:hypothetical protein
VAAGGRPAGHREVPPPDPSAFSQRYVEAALLANWPSPRCWSGCSRPASIRTRCGPGRRGGARSEEREQARPPDHRRARRGRQPRPRPHHPGLPRGYPGHLAHQLLPGRRDRVNPRTICPSSSTRSASPSSRRRARSSRSGSTARGSRASTCASGRWPAAGCAGATGARTSAPRCSAWSRRRWSRTPSSCRPEARAGSSPSNSRTRPGGAPRGGRRGIQDLHLRPARPDGQPRRCRDRPAAEGRAARPRRPLPRRRRRQGHRDVLRYRQWRLAGLRLLARRRLRLRRLQRL